jgi:hypothetical protein
MRKGLLVVLSAGLLVSLLVLGCGGSGGEANLQSGAEWPGPPLEKASSIPPPGTVLIPRTVDWTSLFGGASRAVSTDLTLGLFSITGGAPTSSSVLQTRIDLYAVQANSTANPLVWTMTPKPGTKGKLGDNDLTIYAPGSGVLATSAYYGSWEEWAAFTPPAIGQYYGLIYGAPDQLATHLFRVEADRSSPLTINGTVKTGKENVPGSDWFHFLPVWNGASSP